MMSNTEQRWTTLIMICIMGDCTCYRLFIIAQFHVVMLTCGLHHWKFETHTAFLNSCFNSNLYLNVSSNPRSLSLTNDLIITSMSHHTAPLPSPRPTPHLQEKCGLICGRIWCIKYISCYVVEVCVFVTIQVFTVFNQICQRVLAPGRVCSHVEFPTLEVCGFGVSKLLIGWERASCSENSR